MKTRSDRYLALIEWGERLVGHTEPLERICLPPVGNSGRAPDFLAYAEWSLFTRTRELRHAEAARRLLAGPRTFWKADTSYHRQANLLDEFCHYPFGVVFAGLREAGLLSPEEDQTAAQVLEGSLRFFQEYPSFFSGGVELDVGNLGITPACGADFASRHIFKGAFSRSLRQWADKVWHGYWAVGDCGEDATNYEPLHFVYMPVWAKFRRQMRALRAFVENGSYERCLQQLLPIGVPVDQGDSQWMSGWDGWIAAFEIAATVTRDGRFAWAAQRLLDALEASGYRPAMEAALTAAVAGDARCAFALAHFPASLFFLSVAAEWADEAVAAVEPSGHASAITYRSYPALPLVWEENPLGGGSAAMTQFPHRRGERHEDKLILRSGYGPNANCLIASLDHKAYHDHEDSGAVLAWVDQGGVLLHCPGYTQRRLNAHNVLYVQPRAVDPEQALAVTYYLRGTGYPQNRCVAEFVEDFSAVAMAAYRSVHLGGLDARWRRTLIFPRDGAFLAVLDELESRSDDVWAAPLWHVQNVHARSDIWADTDQGELWAYPNLTWRREARRLLVVAPLGGPLHHIRQDNPDLEPRAGMTRDDRLRLWGQQECLYQLADVQRGSRGWFLTLLVPHEPATSGAEVAARVRVLAQEPSSALPPGSPPAWCLELVDEGGTRHLVGMVPPRLPAFYSQPRVDHTGYLPSWAQKLDVGDPHADRTQWFTVREADRTLLSTDAEIFYIRQAPDRTEVAVRRMRNLEFGGLRHYAGLSPVWSPTRFQVNAEFLLDGKEARARYACRNLNPLELSFGFVPQRVQVTGGANGVPSTVRQSGATLHVTLNALAEITAAR